jgi:hypothetical protein
MLSYDFSQAIGILSKELNEQQIEYALIGSSNLALQGMKLFPRDLDLVMGLKDLRKTPEIFRKYHASAIEELRPDSGDPAWTAKLQKHPAWNVHFNIERIPVQILGEPADGDYVFKLLDKRLVYISVEGIRVPCFTLETEADVYQETFRPEKAERIIAFLKTKRF